MSDDLKGYIYNNLDQKETDELVEIWQKNDRVEWSDETFDVLEQILRRRLGDIPTQNKPIIEYQEQLPQVKIVETIPEDFFNIENAPTFYEPREVLLLSTWLNRMALISIGVSVILGLYSLRYTFLNVWGLFFETKEQLKILAGLIAFVIQMFDTGLMCVFIYLSLKALSHFLKIIMEMEFNSRGVKFVFSEKKNKQV